MTSRYVTPSKDEQRASEDMHFDWSSSSFETHVPIFGSPITDHLDSPSEKRTCNRECESSSAYSGYS